MLHRSIGAVEAEELFGRQFGQGQTLCLGDCGDAGAASRNPCSGLEILEASRVDWKARHT
jgi:hypothetical protein